MRSGSVLSSAANSASESGSSGSGRLSASSAGASSSSSRSVGSSPTSYRFCPNRIEEMPSSAARRSQKVPSPPSLGNWRMAPMKLSISWTVIDSVKVRPLSLIDARNPTKLFASLSTPAPLRRTPLTSSASPAAASVSSRRSLRLSRRARSRCPIPAETALLFKG